MKIIEKKCPDCGADLKFDIKDKETKCRYCKSEFIIEDNNIDKNNINLDDIVLNKKIIKVFSIFHFLIAFVIFAITIAMFIVGFNHFKDSEGVSNEKTVKININEIDEKIENKLVKASINEIKKWNIMHNNYELDGEYEEAGLYYLKNTLSVRIIVVLKYTYKNESDSKTIYCGIKYMGNDINSLNYTPHLNTNQVVLGDFDYAYGYESIEELYDGFVRSDKSLGYKIVASKDLFID